jgi:type IV pilus assembly protein PilV
MDEEYASVKHDQSGFTLIESMVAAAILVVGLLALSGMQAMSFRKNISGSEMTKISNLAADMVERIQFNRRNVTGYHNINVSSGTTTCPTTAVNVMANGDCTQWRTLLLSSGLSNVVGTVTLNPAPPAVDALGLTRSTVTVRLDWVANSNAGGGAAMTKSISLVTVVAPE